MVYGFSAMVFQFKMGEGADNWLQHVKGQIVFDKRAGITYCAIMKQQPAGVDISWFLHLQNMQTPPPPIPARTISSN
jgi:hypothetical protein